MKNILKNKQGFTLIELLVVIGILAVLAAIAIPSVAGLIDRANKSADNSNANEMTNAVERFVSEYELYKQDIASGTINFDNLDSAQSRVYNVIEAKTRDEITQLESLEGLNGKRLNIETKTPETYETIKAIIKNYEKTSSSTFEPKQSDMSYWYNKTTGYVVVAETDIKYDKLYDALPSNVEYGSTSVAFSSDWINLSADTEPASAEILYSYRQMASLGWTTFVYLRVPHNVTNPNEIGLIVMAEDIYNSVDGEYLENTPHNNFVTIDDDYWCPKVAATNTHDIYRCSFLNDENLNTPVFIRTFASYQINEQNKYAYSGVVKLIPANLSTDSNYNFDVN